MTRAASQASLLSPGSHPRLARVAHVLPSSSTQPSARLDGSTARDRRLDSIAAFSFSRCRCGDVARAPVSSRAPTPTLSLTVAAGAPARPSSRSSASDRRQSDGPACTQKGIRQAARRLPHHQTVILILARFKTPPACAFAPPGPVSATSRAQTRARRRRASRAGRFHPSGVRPRASRLMRRRTRSTQLDRLCSAVSRRHPPVIHATHARTPSRVPHTTARRNRARCIRHRPVCGLSQKTPNGSRAVSADPVKPRRASPKTAHSATRRPLG